MCLLVGKKTTGKRGKFDSKCLIFRENLWSVESEELLVEDDRDEEWENNDRKAKPTILVLLEVTSGREVHACFGCIYSFRKYHEKTSRSVRVSLLRNLCLNKQVEGGNPEQNFLEMDDLFDRLEAAGMTLDRNTKVCTYALAEPPVIVR